MLNFMREQCTDLASKVNALELDKTEHSLVIQALEPLAPDRKCFRMIGNIVVERTIAEVLPAVKKNRDQASRAARARGLRDIHQPSLHRGCTALLASRALATHLHGPNTLSSRALVSHKPACCSPFLLLTDWGDDYKVHRDPEHEAKGGRRLPEEAQDLLAERRRRRRPQAGC